MNDQIQLEAYYNHLKYPEQTDVENWLMAEKKLKKQTYRKNLQQFYERYRIVYKKSAIDKTKVKDCPTKRDAILFIVRKNEKREPHKNIHKYCICKNMNRAIKTFIERINYTQTQNGKYVII